MHIDLRIRDYKPLDFGVVIKLWSLVDMAGKERADTNEVIMRTIQNGGRFIILELNGNIIGTSWLTHDYRRSYIHHFCIHPEEQGKGYANVLMDETMISLKSIGYQVKLEVHRENFKAISLYKKYGFIDFPDYELMMNRNFK
jgi:ribosomal protein S18 acetylase RimI-like enzyme